MKVYTIEAIYLEEEDFGGYQQHRVLVNVSPTQEKAEAWIENNKQWIHHESFHITEWTT